MKRNQFVNAQGEIIDAEDGICPDGCGITTKMMMLDGLDDTQREIATRYGRRAQIVDAFGLPAGQRQGYAFVDTSGDDPRITAYADAARRSSNAWRPEAKMPVVGGKVTTGDARANAYATYKERITNAWRSAR
jgi:hypothetical protein